MLFQRAYVGPVLSLFGSDIDAHRLRLVQK